MADFGPSSSSSSSGGTSNPWYPAGTGYPVDLSQYISYMTKRGVGSLDRSDAQYKWAQDQFAKNQATADTIQQRALDTGKTFADQAATDRAFYEGTYMPAMAQQMAYAQQYTTPERMAANRAAALTGAALASDTAKAAAERNLSSIGVDPSAGRYAGLEAGWAQKKALMQAGVGTQSDRQTEMMGQQLLANAIKTGQVLPSQAINEAGVSLAANKEAADVGLATTASGAATMGTPMQWEQLGTGQVQEWKNALIDQTKLGMQQNQSAAENYLKQQQIDLERQKQEQSQSSGIGALLGAGLGIAGSFIGGPAGGMIGSMAGNALGSAFGGGRGGGGGGGFGGFGGFGGGTANFGGYGTSAMAAGTFARGGRVKRMRYGGPVTPPDVEDDEEEPRDDNDDDENMPQRPPVESDTRSRPLPRHTIREPWDPNEPWPGESSGRENAEDLGSPRHPNLGERPDEIDETPSYQQGGVVNDPVIRKNYDVANRELRLTPQERTLYQQHLDNLWTDKGYDHPSGDRSTYYMTPYEAGGRHYALPGVADGRLLDVPETVSRAQAQGLDRYPSYGSREELEGRYRDIHQYMDQDTRDWNAVRRGPISVGGYQRGGAVFAGRDGRQYSTSHFQEGGVVGDVYGAPQLNPPEKRFYDSAGREWRAGDITNPENQSPALTRKLFRDDPQVATGELPEHRLVERQAGPSARMFTGDYLKTRDLFSQPLNTGQYAGGGAIDQSQPVQGNMVPPEASPSNGAQTDDVHAMLNEGEFVVPKPVASWYGEKFLQNLIKKAYQEMSQPKAEGEPAPPQAVALSPPTFQSAGASA
jgi:hypothetical protein